MTGVSSSGSVKLVSMAPTADGLPQKTARREQFVRRGLFLRMTRSNPCTFGTRAAAGALVGTALLGFACTSAKAPRQQEGSDVVQVEPARVDPAKTEAPQAQPLSLQPWVWYHAVTPSTARGLMDVGVSDVSYQHIVGAPRRYVAKTGRDGLELRREDLTESEGVKRPAWSISIPGAGEAPTDAVVLAEPRSTDVVLGFRIDSGYVLRRYNQDGELQWVTTGADPDPPGTRPSMLQLATGGTSMVVYNRRASGSYLDEVDFETGHAVARAVVRPAVLSSGFQWPPPSAIRAHELGHTWPTPAGSFVVRKRGNALVVDHSEPGGKSLWSSTLDPQGGGWWNQAVLLQQRESVIVVAYHGSSSGAVAYGLNRRDGTKLFDASPGSIGSIGHSKYSNELALTVDAAGHVLTHGNESGGRYIGVLDVAAGRLLGREVWRN